MHDLQLLLEHHRHEAGAQQRAAERERSAKLARQAARMERWANRSERLSKRLADMAQTRRLLAQ
jgi:hypothetical protein